MDTIKMWLFLIFLLVVIVALIMGLVALISKFSKNTDAPTWCNPNSLDPNVFGFHCPSLSLAYTATDNRLKTRVISLKDKPWEFEGNAQDIKITFARIPKAEEYAPGSSNKDRGYWAKGITVYCIEHDRTKVEFYLNDRYKYNMDVFLDKVRVLSNDYLLKSEAVINELKAKEQADKAAAEQKAKADALQNVHNQCSKLLSDWGIDPEGAFKTYRYRDDDGGYICTMLAADKEGRGGAVLNDGKDTWSGSWKNAQVSEVGETLEVQIDDPEYRKKNLKEHRFVIKHMDREQRVEWIDRIRILSAQT